MERKTYGFLVAVESDKPVSGNLIYQAIDFYLDDRGYFNKLGQTKLDVTEMGEIPEYEEQRTGDEGV